MSAEYRRILVVVLVLVVLTAVEFAIAIYLESAALLFVAALAKAALVVNYFMHVYRLWRPESH